MTTFDKKFPITVMDVILTGHLPNRFKLLHRFKGHDYDHGMEVMKSLGIDHLAKKNKLASCQAANFKGS